MMSEINSLRTRIKEIKENIASIDNELAYIDTRIDSIECHRRNDDKLDELYNESKQLDASKESLKKEMKLLEEEIYLIEKIDELKTEASEKECELKNIVDDEDSDTRIGELSVELGAINSELDELNNNLKMLLNRKNNNINKK